MAFIDTSATHVALEIDQINACYVGPRQEVEIAFKFVPGQYLAHGAIHRIVNLLGSRTSGDILRDHQRE